MARWVWFAMAAVLSAPTASAEDAALRDPSAAVRLRGLVTLRAGSPEAEDARLPDQLVRLLASDPAPPVRAAAAAAAGRLGLAAALPQLWTAATRDPDPEVGEAAARAAGRVVPAGDRDVLLAGLAARATRTRLVAAVALGEVSDPRARAALRTALLTDPDWAVRAAAALAMGPGATTVEIAVLYDRLTSDLHPAVRAGCAEALEQSTGRRLGPDPAAWRRARDAGPLMPGALPPLPPPEPGRTTADAPNHHWIVTYWGIPVVADRILFCFDCSGSMNFYERLGLARQEQNATVAAMPTDGRFGVLFFNHEQQLWLERLVPAGPLVKLALAEHLVEREAKGYTDLLTMFERAFGVAGQGRLVAPWPERFRTMFVLSDGVPSRQFVTSGATIRAAVAKWNPGRRVVIHGIGLGNADAEFLRGLAEENGGRFVAKGNF